MSWYEELRQHLIEEAHEDEVGLWYIVNNVRRELDAADFCKVHRVTMQLVEDMLKSRKVVAADHASKERGVPLYRPWRLPPEKIVARIEAEWDKLGHEPNIAEIVVFVGLGHPFTDD